MSWSLRASMGCPFRKFDPSDSQCEAESSHHQVRCLPWGALAIFGHLTRARGGGRGFPFLFFAGCRPLVPPGKRDADRAAELRRRSRWPPMPPICRYGQPIATARPAASNSSSTRERKLFKRIRRKSASTVRRRRRLAGEGKKGIGGAGSERGSRAQGSRK